MPSIKIATLDLRHRSASRSVGGFSFRNRTTLGIAVGQIFFAIVAWLECQVIAATSSMLANFSTLTTVKHGT